MIVNPCADHMRVLLVEVCWAGCPVQGHLFVIAVVIGVEGLVSPEHHLTPKVRVLTTFMHRCVGLKILFDVEFVLFECKFNVFGIGFCCKNPVEVSAHSVLLIVESIEVGSSNCINVLCQ